MLPPRLKDVYANLLTAASPEGSLTLEAVADAVLPYGASSEEIEALVAALEAAGVAVGEALGSAREALAVVLPAARALGERLGRRPTVDDIAAETGLSPGRVRGALGFGKTLGR